MSLARSLWLKDLARCSGRPVKTRLNRLSAFLSSPRLTTHHEKVRSRGKEKVLGPGYQEIWIGVLLKDRSCLGHPDVQGSVLPSPHAPRRLGPEGTA